MGVPCTAILGEQAQQLLHFAHERRKTLSRLATIGARFRHDAKGFYGPDSLPSMGKKTAASEGRSACASLHEVPGLAEVETAGDSLGPRRSRTRRHAPGAQGGN